MIQLPCLSLQQPWPELIIRGHKKVENRSWKTQYTGWLGIHASKSKATRNEFPDELEDYLPDWAPALEDFGHFVGIAWLEGCFQPKGLPKDLLKHEFASTFPETWCWVLRGAQRLPRPIPAKGQAALFYVAVAETQLPVDVNKPPKV